MIKWIRNWIRDIVLDTTDPGKVVPSVITHSTPTIQIYKITNGYVVYKNNTGPYRDGDSTVIFCATPMEVARQIVNGETLDKMGILGTTPDQMKTVGKATGSFVNQI